MLLLIFFVKILFFSVKKFRNSLPCNKKGYYHKTLKKTQRFKHKFRNNDLYLLSEKGFAYSALGSITNKPEKRCNIFLPFYFSNFFHKTPYSVVNTFLIQLKTVYCQSVLVQNSVFASASMTQCKVLRTNNLFQLILPSGVSKLIDPWSAYTVDLGVHPKKRKIIVRGIAKNPIDHPNGGNSNIKKPFKTPWGLIAKHGK